MPGKLSTGCQRIWDTSEISRKTKLKLLKTIVSGAVLMYGCEAQKLTKTEAKKLDAFRYKRMERILRKRWHQTISHQQIQEITRVNRGSDEIRRRRWNWIGHIMRKNWEEHCVTSLGWRPEGRRRPGRPKTTWGRMVGRRKASSWVAVLDDCQSFSSKQKWMERQCQSLMCLMARRGRDRDIPHTDLTAIIFGSEGQAVTQCTRLESAKQKYSKR